MNIQTKLLPILWTGVGFCIISSTGWAQQENLKTQRSPFPFSGPRNVLQLGSVSGIAYSPDGKTLLSGHYSANAYFIGGTGELRLWDAATGTFLRTLTNNGNNVTSVAFSPDGKTIACGSFSYIPLIGQPTGGIGEVTLWDVQTGELQKTLAGHRNTNCVVFSPDGQTLATAGSTSLSGGEVKLWNAQTGELLRTISKADTFNVGSVVFAPDGKTFVTGGDGNRVTIWNTRSGEVQQTLAIPQSLYMQMQTVAFSPDGKLLAASGRKVLFPPLEPPNAHQGIPAEVLVWDVETGQLRYTLKGHTGLVMAVAFSPDGKTLASGGYGGEVRAWDVLTGDFVGQTSRWMGVDDRKLITALAFSPDGKTLASGSDDGTVKLWHIPQPEAKAAH